MRSWVAGLGLAALALLAACGGNVTGGGSGEGEGEGEQEPSGERPGEPALPDPVYGAGADTELGECTLGPSARGNYDKPCAWVAEGRCYASRAMACNCACPRVGTSQCTSGFDDGEYGRVGVSCE